MRDEILYPAGFALTLTMVLLMVVILLRRRKEKRPMSVTGAGMMLVVGGGGLVQSLIRLIDLLLDGPSRWTLWAALITVNLTLATAGAWWYFSFIRRSPRSEQRAEPAVESES